MNLWSADSQRGNWASGSWLAGGQESGGHWAIGLSSHGRPTQLCVYGHGGSFQECQQNYVRPFETSAGNQHEVLCATFWSLRVSHMAECRFKGWRNPPSSSAQEGSPDGQLFDTGSYL